MSEMHPAKRLDHPSLLSLPDDLFDVIGSSLDLWDLGRLELVNKRFRAILSTPSRTEPCGWCLDLKPLFRRSFNPEASR